VGCIQNTTALIISWLMSTHAYLPVSHTLALAARTDGSTPPLGRRLSRGGGRRCEWSRSLPANARLCLLVEAARASPASCHSNRILLLLVVPPLFLMTVFCLKGSRCRCRWCPVLFAVSQPPLSSDFEARLELAEHASLCLVVTRTRPCAVSDARMPRALLPMPRCALGSGDARRPSCRAGPTTTHATAASELGATPTAVAPPVVHAAAAVVVRLVVIILSTSAKILERCRRPEAVLLPMPGCLVCLLAPSTARASPCRGGGGAHSGWLSVSGRCRLDRLNRLPLWARLVRARVAEICGHAGHGDAALVAHAHGVMHLEAVVRKR
jgi:hypothetical protein